MAPILIAENQYSKWPNALTLMALQRISAAENRRIQIHPATSGNQYFMYSAMAVTSVPTARTMAAQ
ncbi:hypothetical protein D3C78_1470370 [compost metagenome]